MELTYTQKGDYLYPNIEWIPEESIPLDKYGMLRRIYLKQHRHAGYEELVITNRLNQHLKHVDDVANEMMDTLMNAMAREESVTEALKAADQMEWVRRMNNIRDHAEKIVLNDLVYR